MVGFLYLKFLSSPSIQLWISSTLGYMQSRQFAFIQFIALYIKLINCHASEQSKDRQDQVIPIKIRQLGQAVESHS